MSMVCPCMLRLRQVRVCVAGAVLPLTVCVGDITFRIKRTYGNVRCSMLAISYVQVAKNEA